VRGYVTAYDTKTGEQDWRFYTVPGDPNLPFEHPEMEEAAKTWKGGEWWKIGGGGTVWNSIVYDPDTDTVFLGVGNGSPWTRTIRSPGGGDNLFLSSIVALDPNTGVKKWHYQTTPGDTWDYTAVQDMMLADMEIDGKSRKVIMQAPKNGFFYVLDRETGELLRANPYVTVNWATHIDMDTGRPVEKDSRDFNKSGQSKWILPGPLGGHNWMAMSFNPNTGLVYIPAMESPLVFDVDHDFKATGRSKPPAAINISKAGGTQALNLAVCCPWWPSIQTCLPTKAISPRLTRLRAKPIGCANMAPIGMAALCRPKRAWFSKAMAMAISWPMTPRRAKKCGRSTPTQAPLPRPLPMRLMASNMLPFKWALAARV